MAVDEGSVVDAAMVASRVVSVAGDPDEVGSSEAVVAVASVVVAGPVVVPDVMLASPPQAIRVASRPQIRRCLEENRGIRLLAGRPHPARHSTVVHVGRRGVRVTTRRRPGRAWRERLGERRDSRMRPPHLRQRVATATSRNTAAPRRSARPAARARDQRQLRRVPRQLPPRPRRVSGDIINIIAVPARIDM